MRKKTLEWVRSKQNTQFAKDARRRFIEDKQKKLYEQYKVSDSKKEIEQEIRSLEKVLQGKGVTDADIAQAREYPIGDIVKVNKYGYALCPAHDDTRPSMYCKNNYAKCFSCDYYADVITLYREVHNVSFTEAVNQMK